MAKKKAAPKKKAAVAAPVKRKRVDRVSIWVGAGREAATDGMFAAAAQAVSDATGLKGVCLGSEQEDAQVGLPLPALCLRYLFQSTVLTLGRVIQLAGRFGSCKTAFLNELMRWHMVYGGGGALAECENKDAQLMRKSILEYNPMWLRRIEFGEANTLQQWQQFLTASLIQFQTALDMPGGPGRTIPICFGIDSLTAVDSQTEIDKTTEAGHASLGYAVQANLITRYMRQAVVERLRGYPFTICGTNHLKQKIEATTNGMPPGNKSPGGEAVNFMATFLIEMNRIQDVATMQYEGIRVGFKLEKNSIGPSRKRIEAELLWWWEPDPISPGNFRQRIAWDWHTATIDLLNSFSDPKSKKKTLGAMLKEITGLVKDTKSTSHSRILGYSEPTENRLLGLALEARPDLLDQMYPLLGINRYSVFQPGMDYQQMLTDAQQRIADAAPIYEPTQLPTIQEQYAGPSADFDPEAPPEDDVPTEGEGDGDGSA